MAKGPRGAREGREVKVTRNLIARVLLICEGKKTEPNYLNDLVNELRVPTVGFEVVGEGSDPSVVVERAIVRAESPDGDYDFIFCVFDRDKHEKYAEACNQCRNRSVKRKGVEQTKLIAITTNPSFEYWLLLHLKPTTKSYRQAGRKSSGDQVLAEFSSLYKKHTGLNYKKGSAGVYKALRNELNSAIKFSEGANREGLGNPHSLVGAMVTVLRDISEGNKPDIKKIEALKRLKEVA
ncbi:RloB family protein [Dyella sp. 20L07]|uniref:RloB family protein n=1 Tax=Dyella sp. 20L07 TaxID=3384240 RepID=UPI003D2B8B1E